MDKEIPRECVHIFHKAVEQSFSLSFEFKIRGAKPVDDVLEVDEYKQIAALLRNLEEIVVHNKYDKITEKFQRDELGSFERVVKDLEHPVDTFTREYLVRRIISAYTSDDYNLELSEDRKSLKIVEQK